jgi:hypothetical protein
VRVSENTTSSPQYLPYQQTCALEWTEKAFSMLESGNLHGAAYRAPEQVVVTRVWGECPRCGHTLNDQQTHDAITNLTGGTRRTFDHRPKAAQAAPPGVFTVDVTCECADATHPSTPTSGAGCGVSFRVEVPFADIARP